MVVILAVELKPLLPWVEMVVVQGSRERVRRMDGSSFMVVVSDGEDEFEVFG